MKLTNSLGILGIICLALAATTGSGANSEAFGGFGITVAQLFDVESRHHMGPIVVLFVPPESDAAKAGIQNGDVILEVDGNRTSGKQFEQVVRELLRGPVSSSATLKLRKSPDGKTVTVNVKRTRITYSPTEGK